MENIILNFYREILAAEEKAEKKYDEDKESAKKRKIYECCFAQRMCMEELMDKLGIDWEEDDDE